MDEKALRALTTAWPGVTVDVKWDHDLIFMVGAARTRHRVTP